MQLLTIRKKIKKRWKLVSLLLLVLIGLLLWWNSRRAAQTEELTFIQPVRGELTKVLEVDGVIAAKEYARVRFAAGGKLTYLGAQEGSLVQRGQTIATLDQRSIRKNLEKSLNQFDRERLDWEQTQDAIKDRWIPSSEERVVEQNNIDLKNTVLDVETTTLAIESTRLSAPLTGVLVASPTNVTGVEIGPSDVFEIVNPGSLMFLAYVDEADMSAVRIGQSATIVLDAYTDQQLGSTIRYIGYKSLQSSSGTVFAVEFPISQPDLNRYRLGMNGNASITLEQKADILSIPLDATIERDGAVYVRVKTGEDTAEDRAITVGMETDDRVEVLSGLSEADYIVLPE